MKIIDLTQPMSSEMKVYPGDPEVKITQIHTIEKEGWRLRSLFFGSHAGTHVDAFAHMDQKGKTIDQIPLERFCGRAVVVSAKVKFPRKIGLGFIKEKLDFLLSEKIFNAHTPFILVNKDCEFEVELERKLLQNKVLTFTDLTNMEQLPRGQEFMFYGFPLNIKNGDGSPIRAVAFVD